MTLDYIDLKDQEPFARGAWKDAYKVPDHPDLCVAVLRKNSNRKLPWYRFWRSKYINSELYRTYHQYCYIKKYKPHLLPNVTPMLGMVQTSKGEGLVSKLITNDDQTISKPFPVGLSKEQAFSSMHAFKDQGIRVFDFNLGNALIQRNKGQFKIIWIEDYEAPYLPWMSWLLKPYLDHRTKRYWRKFFERLETYYENIKRD